MYLPRDSREPADSSDWQKVWFLAHEALEMSVLIDSGAFSLNLG